MDPENMTPEEAIMDQAKIIVASAALDKKDVVTYETFCETMKDDREVDVDEIAAAAGFNNGRDYLRKLGLNLNDNGDFIVIREETIVTKFLEGKRLEDQQRAEKKKRYQQPVVHIENYQRQPTVAEQQVFYAQQSGSSVSSSTITNESYDLDFDGDEKKLLPGMRVRIATGTIHHLPRIPYDQCHRFVIKAGQKYRKHVREIVALHQKMVGCVSQMYGKPADKKDEE